MSGMIRLDPRPTVVEIARAARVHPQTILIAHRRGDLGSGVRLGKALTFDARAVAEWLASRGIHNVVLADEAVTRETEYV